MAQLLDSSVPGPALAQISSNQATRSIQMTIFDAPVTMPTIGTYYAMTLVALTPGTYSLAGIGCLPVSGALGGCSLSLASGASVSSWPGKQFVNGFCQFVTAVVKVTSNTNVYFNQFSTNTANDTGYGAILATRIK